MADSRYSFVFEHIGMLQTDRQASAPAGDAMKVSGRRFEDLVKRTAEFAESVIFYGDDNRVRGDWSVFFSQIYDRENHRVRTEIIDEMVRTSSVSPHLALLFAFYKMLLVEQKDLNKLTDRQMDFYFREILGFEPARSSEGSVTVFADLAKGVPSVSIPKGHPFDAGKDAGGQAVVYESIDELKLGREEVAFFSSYDDFNGFEASKGGTERDTKHAVCVTSRLFALAGSSLQVRIGEEKSQRMLKRIPVEYTSAEGWTPAGIYDEKDGVTIGEGLPPMAPYNPLVHGEGMETAYPVIRFVSRHGIGKLSGIVPDQLRQVTVTLAGGVPLRLENKYGTVENLPGVNPFGFEGHKGDMFSVILPFPSPKFEVSVEMNVTDKDIFDKAPESGPDEGKNRGKDRETFVITSHACDQEYLSREFSRKVLTIMKKGSMTEEEIKKAMDEKIMAVSPRLTAPVTVRTAEYSDVSAKVYFSHPCGMWEVTGRPFVNEGFRFVRPVRDEDEPDSDVFYPVSSLYIAFTDADLDRGQLSLYVRVSRWVKDPGRVRWYGLRGDNWSRFGESRILRDTTSGLSQDGTIVLDYQEPLPVGGSGLMDGYTWIKAECSNANCREVTGIRSRAVELMYSPSSKGAGPGGAVLPAGTISKAKVSIAGLKKISQPFGGLIGEKAEDQAFFRRRVAETLRHKGRAWTAWDYECLVLDLFPEVAYAKCLPSCDETGQPSPGVVMMVVIPEDSENDLEPAASVRLINKVSEKVKEISSPFVTLRIVEPSYKRIKVTASIVLRKGFNDPVRYEARTNDALLDYLRSWKGHGNGLHFREGNGVSDIIAFLETLPYVDYIESIKVTLDNERVNMDGSVELDSPLDVITSEEGHEIRCRTAN